MRHCVFVVFCSLTEVFRSDYWNLRAVAIAHEWTEGSLNLLTVGWQSISIFALRPRDLFCFLVCLISSLLGRRVHGWI